MITKFSKMPLKTNVLRTKGLASVQGAMFGMTRNGGTRAHQGIDLATDEGYRVYAVEDAKVVAIATGTDAYGFIVNLKLDCPTKKELHNRFAFYAHLDRIDVKVGQVVKAGKQIGLSGDTGNAKGMTSVEKGGHLHFEIRTRQVTGKGLANRIDPLPFINLSTEP